jgi:hypothetical protein
VPHAPASEPPRAALLEPGPTSAVFGPVISGSVEGGRHGWPFCAATFDLGAAGYREDEWLLSGDATCYRHKQGTGRSWDGHWSAEADRAVPFCTRILVRRPQDATRFNGTVVLMWTNVSLGFDLFAGESPEIYDGGFAFAAVSVQRNGVHGYPGGASPGLTLWDPERYGSLSVPSDDAAYDIFTQAARAVRAPRAGTGAAGSPDLLGGLEVHRVIGLGASQSAVWLATYLNAVQPLTGALDGLILDIYFGNGSSLQSESAARPSLARPQEITAAVTEMKPGSHLLREDLGIPIFVLNSETEATLHYSVRQQDTDRYRYWEVAGAAHGSRRRGSDRLPSNWPRDLGVEDSPLGTPLDANVLTLEPVRSAVLGHMQRWLTDATPPPIQPRIAFDTTGAAPTIQRDRLGLAVGGIRLPALEAPTARHSGLAADGTLRLTGSTTPLPPAELSRLYADHDDYVRRYAAATTAAIDRGVLRPADGQELIDQASVGDVLGGSPHL